MKKLLVFAVMITAVLLGKADAGIVLSSGNVVVLRVGNGSAPLTNAATAIFLEERDGATGALVQTYGFDTTGANRLTMSGTATSEGKIKYHNGFLATPGYDADAGTAGIAGTTSAAANRSVAVMAGNTGNISYTRLTDAYGGNNIRSAISDGTNIWMAGTATAPANAGVRHTTVGSTTSTQLSVGPPTNVRTVNIFQNQLYVSHNSGTGTVRIMEVGTGLPTTSGQSQTGLPGFPTTGDFYDFFMADLDGSVAGHDVLFAAIGTNIEKFSLVGGNWVSNGTISLGSQVFGLDGINNGGAVRLFANTAGFVRGYDLTSSYNTAFAANLLWQENAGTNTAFRGLAAIPEPSSMALLSVAGVGGWVVRRFRRKKNAN